MQVTPRNNDEIADIIEPNGLKLMSLELSLVILSAALKNNRLLIQVWLWEDSHVMYKKNEISVIFYFISILKQAFAGFFKMIIAEILTFNSVGTQLFFLGCNQDNIGGSNFITKKKICLVLPEKEISNHRN